MTPREIILQVAAAIALTLLGWAVVLLMFLL